MATRAAFAGPPGSGRAQGLGLRAQAAAGLRAYGSGWLKAQGSGKNLIQLRRRDAEVRGVPDDLAVLEQDGLRGLVAQPEPLSNRVRDRAVRLHRDHLVGDVPVRA